MYNPDKTLPIELTLEESGRLCHYMMADKAFRELIINFEVNRKKLTPLEERLIQLYNKLAKVNDELMGKPS